MDTITGTVTRVERKGHTVYGNPIKVVTLSGLDWFAGFGDEYSFRISDNASLAYEIENGEFRDQPHTFALTRAGRISHVIR